MWTAHDLLPHEEVFLDDRTARRVLLVRADVVIALSQVSASALRARVRALDVRVIPFGSYAAPYPITLERAEARRRLGIEPDDVAVLLIGKVERYKGADLLLEAVAELPSSSPVKALVVGACADNTYRAALYEQASTAGRRAVVKLERIPDGDMSTYLCAADFGVFPFRAVTNSSSVLLTQSFGLPVIIPALTSLSDVPPEASLRYEPGGAGLRVRRRTGGSAERGTTPRYGRGCKTPCKSDRLADRRQPPPGDLPEVARRLNAVAPRSSLSVALASEAFLAMTCARYKYGREALTKQRRVEPVESLRPLCAEPRRSFRVAKR